MVQLPMSLAPFGALVITSIIIPQASFIGHLSGILMGYFMAYVIYGATVNLWCSLALLVLLVAGKQRHSLFARSFLCLFFRPLVCLFVHLFIRSLNSSLRIRYIYVYCATQNAVVMRRQRRLVLTIHTSMLLLGKQTHIRQHSQSFLHFDLHAADIAVFDACNALDFQQHLAHADVLMSMSAVKYKMLEPCKPDLYNIICNLQLQLPVAEADLLRSISRLVCKSRLTLETHD